MTATVSWILLIFTNGFLFEKGNYTVYLQVSSKPFSGSISTNYIILKGNLGNSPLTVINNFPNGSANPAVLQDGQLATIKDKFPNDYGYINTATVGNFGDTLLMQSLNIFDNMRNLWSNMTFIYPIGYIQISSSTDFLYSVNGNWSDWSSWGTCSVTCNTGTVIRQRTCTNPSPANGGLACNGSSTQWQVCINSTCPTYSWSDWSIWSECSVTCDVGFQTRSRNCTGLSNEGMNCNGNNYDFQVCFNNSTCPVDGEWNLWSNWSACIANCGSIGTIQRTRQCNKPSSTLGGLNCSGPFVDIQSCFNTSQNCQTTTTTKSLQGSTDTLYNNCSLTKDENSLKIFFQLKFLFKSSNEYLVKFSKWWCGVFRCN